jgi:hypothetical protein
MAILEIELQPSEQARLQQEAQTEGLLLEELIRHRLLSKEPSFAESLRAAREAVYDPNAKPLWEIIAELDAVEVPAEEKARMPHDGSINYKHYLYGAPKVDGPKDLQ